MGPIFDAEGDPVGWLREGVVYDLDGAPRAFLQGENIFDYDGLYLGWLDRGFFRDTAGDAVAFLSGATGGPLQPLTRLPPLAPMLQLPPLRPLPALPPLPPLPSLDWSDLEWEDFLAGTE